MYPSKRNPGYGVFVKNFETSMRLQDFQFDRAVIRGRASSKIEKLLNYSSFFLRTLYKLIFRKYDLVYIHYVAHSALPLLPIIWLKRFNLVCNAHGEDLLPRSKSERLISLLVSKVIKSSKLIVVPSEYFFSIAKKAHPHNKIFISPSAGINVEIFRPIPQSLNNKNSLHLGFVSRIDPGKGWDIILKAAAHIKSNHPNIKLRIDFVGEGSQSNEFFSLINALELDDIVSYLGPMQQSDLPQFYSSLDVFIFPTTLRESLGLVGLEALACGTPSICSNIGGISTYMKDGVNGFLFPPGDHQDLAQKIVDFYYLQPSEKQRLKKAALATAHQYDSTHIAITLSQEIRKTMEAQP